MRRIGKIILAVTSLLLLGSLLGVQLVRKYKAYAVPIEYTERIMGIPVVEDVGFLEGMKQKASGEYPGVYFEGVELPFSKEDNTLYLSQDFSAEDWQGSFLVNAGSGYLCMPKDSYWNQKAEAIREGHTFLLWLVTVENEYYEFQLQVSGMPVISIQTEYSRESTAEENRDDALFGAEVLCYGDIRVFNPGVGSRQYEILECGVEYHSKGDTSLFYDKIGYAVSLQDARGKKVSQQLLGMRSDNSWKLNPLVTDENRIREKTAAQVWELINNADVGVSTPGPRMEYVELVLDNQYQGLYCLAEPVDAKKLGLDNNDVLYKLVSYYAPNEEAILAAGFNKWSTVSGIRIRYPGIITDYPTAWEPLRDYYNTFYAQEKEDSGIRARENITDAGAGNKLHISNVADMMIFTSAVSAGDNYYKNTYLAADVREDGSYTMRRVPWDVDLVFGNVYDNDAHNHVRFNSDVDVYYNAVEFNALLAVNMGDLKGVLRDKWTAYRQGFLSTENMLRLMRENQEYLINSGVVNREKERWRQYEMSLDIDYLLDYQTEHMAWLDGFILSITE